MNVADLRTIIDKDGKEYVCVYDVMQLFKINHNDSVAVYTNLNESTLSRRIESKSQIISGKLITNQIKYLRNGTT